MNKITLIVLILSSTLLFSQRGRTGDKTFENRFPKDVSNSVSNASLELINENNRSFMKE